jgi:hypothetical protein
MEELNTLLIVGLIGFGGGVLVTIAMVLLYMAYNNINVVMDRLKDKEDDDNDDESFVIPMSTLMGAPGGAGGQRLSMADLQAYAARMAAAPAPAAPDDDKKPTGGQYL